MVFDDYDKDRLFTLIYTRVINLFNLPIDMFNRTVKKLTSGLNQGIIEFGKPDDFLIKELTENIYLFSGAKTFQTILDIQGLLVKDGEILSLSEFKKVALERFDLYNETYLTTEYNTAIGQGQIASKWNQIVKDKDVFPLLEYSAIMDSKTSDICEHLDGIVRPVDDAFWKLYSPLNHFSCRCQILQVSKYDEVEQTSRQVVKEQTIIANKKMNDAFKMNPYYDRVVFSDKHPYFDVPKTYKDWAKKNFGLPIK